MRQGHDTLAEAYLREALAQEPSNHELLYQLTLCLGKNGKMDEAENQRRRLDQLKANLKRLEEIATTLLPTRPHDLDLQHEFALISLKTGRHEEGLEWLQRILRAKPSYMPAHQALAEFYHQTGDEEQEAYHRRFLPGANPRYTIEPSVLHPTIQPMPRIGPLPQTEPRP
jgi:tetratricopeptide (TPR) repeat protein